MNKIPWKSAAVTFNHQRKNYLTFSFFFHFYWVLDWYLLQAWSKVKCLKFLHCSSIEYWSASSFCNSTAKKMIDKILTLKRRTFQLNVSYTSLSFVVQYKKISRLNKWMQFISIFDFVVCSCHFMSRCCRQLVHEFVLTLQFRKMIYACSMTSVQRRSKEKRR